MEEVIRLNLGFTKIYLLKAEDGFIQFDTGYKSNLKKYLRLLEKQGIDPKEIKLIIVNHAHFDHVGALKTVKYLTGAQVLAHETDAEFLKEGRSAEVKSLNLRNKLLFKLVPKSIQLYEAVEPDIIIKDDYSLEEFGVDAKVIHTPGHTPGTLSIITKKGNAILGCCVHGFPLRLRPGLPTVAYDLDQIKSSWERILKEGVKNLHSSHGKPLSVEKMQKILRKKKRGVS
jgi:glyoxylase-like metal-dependent hydrolase (beta-lactamase superfamily II)